MEQSKQSVLSVNELPTRTWNRLGVNAAKVPWDAEQQTDLTPTHLSAGEAVQRVHVTDENTPYAKKRLTLTVPEGCAATVFEDCRAEHPLSAELSIELEKNAHLTLVQLFTPQGATLLHQTTAKCAAGASMELSCALLGEGDVYTDTRIELSGEESAFTMRAGYLARDEQTIDMNVVVNHWAKKTQCDIEANGALMDASQKVFRGTIDFKNGSADSVGSENETVLMLGEDAVNKTVPLILCAEETVEGTHGATIGELDGDTLFYFESRGIDKTGAEHIMARAAIERIARDSGDEDWERLTYGALDAALGGESEEEA